MKTKGTMLLVASAGILTMTVFGLSSVMGLGGRCGIRTDAGEQGGHPACHGEAKEQECDSEKSVQDQGAGNPNNAGKEGPVNVKCTIMGTELDKEKLTEELTVEHRGHMVGLCCDHCVEPWAEFSDDEKDEKLAESLELNWHSSPDEALDEAKHRERLLVAEFHAEWCGWCQKWESETLPDQDVQLRLLDFSLLKIDTDEQPEVAQKYGVTGLPTTVVIDSKGDVVLRSAGFRDAEQYLALLAEAEKEAGVARADNVRCPVMGSELDKDGVPDDLLTEHKGQLVGFCCPPCIGSWDALSGEEKDERLRESL